MGHNKATGTAATADLFWVGLSMRQKWTPTSSTPSWSSKKGKDRTDGPARCRPAAEITPRQGGLAVETAQKTIPFRISRRPWIPRLKPILSMSNGAVRSSSTILALSTAYSLLTRLTSVVIALLLVCSPDSS